MEGSNSDLYQVAPSGFFKKVPCKLTRCARSQCSSELSLDSTSKVTPALTARAVHKRCCMIRTSSAIRTIISCVGRKCNKMASITHSLSKARSRRRRMWLKVHGGSATKCKAISRLMTSTIRNVNTTRSRLIGRLDMDRD